MEDLLQHTSMIFWPKPCAISMNWGFWNISCMAEAAAVGSMSAGFGEGPAGAARSCAPPPCMLLCRACDIWANAGSWASCSAICLILGSCVHQIAQIWLCGCDRNTRAPNTSMATHVEHILESTEVEALSSHHVEGWPSSAVHRVTLYINWFLSWRACPLLHCKISTDKAASTLAVGIEAKGTAAYQQVPALLS